MQELQVLVEVLEVLVGHHPHLLLPEFLLLPIQLTQSQLVQVDL
jgi:hypothetical protein